jgi:hypothetical protein
LGNRCVRTMSALTLWVGRCRAVQTIGTTGSPRVDRLHSSSQRDQSPDHLARSGAGESTKTNQRRTCRTSPWCGRHRTPRWWRPSAGGCRAAAHGWRAFPSWARGSAVPSRCPFRGSRKSQAAQVVSSLGRLAAGRKECPFVGLQKLNPIADVARVSHIAVKAKFGTKERSA